VGRFKKKGVGDLIYGAKCGRLQPNLELTAFVVGGGGNTHIETAGSCVLLGQRGLERKEEKGWEKFHDLVRKNHLKQ